MKRKYELNMSLSKEKAKKRIEMGESLKRQDFLLVNLHTFDFCLPLNSQDVLLNGVLRFGRQSVLKIC